MSSAPDCTPTPTREGAATVVEYGLVVSLIALVCIIAVTLIGNNLSTMFSSISGDI